jgi:hypothetical protein
MLRSGAAAGKANAQGSFTSDGSMVGDAPVAKPFDPLETEVLAETLARAFEESPLHSLPPPTAPGSGVYALYYSGPFPLYNELGFARKGAAAAPLYVGRSSPKGGLTGNIAAEQGGNYVVNRLRTHARSIEAVENLRLTDFQCRYLVTSPLWAPLLESLLLRKYRPLWNGMGLGSNATGGPRSGQKVSAWDTLHPGRGGAGKGQSAADAAAVEAQVRANFQAGSDE